MPNIRGDVFLSQRVSEVMVKDVVTVKERSSPEEIGTLLMEYPTFSSFPVVSERRSILGVVSCRHSGAGGQNNPALIGGATASFVPTDPGFPIAPFD
mmetsp:Transcript_15596/g.63647  ORF Transcript_15596/g.63647 Transcript_15596/m.63647 type:complete len:97 (+) Transcript_15596:1675-1965(+)